MDSIPLVVISGQVPTTIIGTDGFKKLMQLVYQDHVQSTTLVNKIEDLPRIIKEVFHIASTGRPGPVHVDIPKDIAAQMAEFIYPEDKLTNIQTNY